MSQHDCPAPMERATSVLSSAAYPSLHVGRKPCGLRDHPWVFSGSTCIGGSAGVPSLPLSPSSVVGGRGVMSPLQAGSCVPRGRFSTPRPLTPIPPSNRGSLPKPPLPCGHGAVGEGSPQFRGCRSPSTPLPNCSEPMPGQTKRKKTEKLYQKPEKRNSMITPHR